MLSLKKSLLVLGICFASTSLPAFAEDDRTGFYLTIGAGLDQIQDGSWNADVSGTKYGGDTGFDSGFAFDGGIGYDFGSVRVEATYVRTNGTLDECSEDRQGVSVTCDDGFETNSYMASAYFDIPTGNEKWIPYLGGGIGQASISPDDITIDGTKYSLEDETTFTYQFKGGISYLMSEKADLFGEIIFKNYAEMDIDYSTAGASGTVGSHNAWGARLGARYRF